MIDDQIAAFQRGDAPRAWQHVSPGLQAQLGTAERFLQLVREHYRPVSDPRSYRYGIPEPVDGGWGQRLQLIGPDGRQLEALYLLQRPPAGTWRTNGCLLFEPAPDAPRA